MSYDDPALLHLLTSLLWKMSYSPRVTVDISSQVLCVTAGSIKWTDLPHRLMQIGLSFSSFVPDNRECIYLLRQLGEGAEGKCFLGCDALGNVCAVKLYRDGVEGVQNILGIWNDVFGLKAFLLSSALVMPYVFSPSWAAAEKRERWSAVDAAMDKLLAKGYYHRDMKWSHVCLLHRNGQDEVVFIDTDIGPLENCSSDERKQEMLAKLPLED